MPQAIPIVVGIVLKAAGVQGLAAALVVAASSVVAGAIQNRQAEKAAAGNSDPANRGYKFTTRSTQVSHRVIYGQCLVGGNEVFIGSSGSNNDYLWSVVNFGEGEVEGLGESLGVDQVFLDNKLYTTYGGTVSYWFHAGASNQTFDTNLQAAFPQATDNRRFTANMVVRLLYDQDQYSGKPNITALIKGRKLYDFRDESTAYSRNPVLAAYDWLTNKRYGLGVDSSLIDLSTWTAAANYVEDKNWNLDMVVDGGNSFDVFEEILRHFRGALVWSEGVFALYYTDLNYESSVKTITDEHIARDASGRAQLNVSQPSMSNRPDGLRIKYVDIARNYTFDDIQIGDQSGLVIDFRLLGSNDLAQIRDLAFYELERRQLDRTISGVFRDDCLELEPHDVVTFSSTALSISNQLMRVVATEVMPNGLIAISMMYEALSLYNQTFDITSENTYSCTLPDPKTAPPAVGNISIEEETYEFRDRTFTRLKITFDQPAGFPSGQISHIEVWISLDEGATYKHQFNVTDSFNIEPAEEEAEYYIKLISVSSFGVKTESGQEAIVNYIVGGLISVPNSLSSLQAIVNQNTINLYAVEVSSSDISVYEFRLGDSWSGAVFLAALNRPNFSLHGVKPGDHTFWANTLRNNDQYGDVPVSKTVSLIEPPDGWTVQHTETDDYTDSGAVFQNTELTTYSAENYLKCSHGSAGLVGTYTSRIFDLGSSDRYMVYLLASLSVTGEGTTWDSQFPGTWEEGAQGRTWKEIFQLYAAPSVGIKLYYGETSPPTEFVDRLEILSAIVTGRYYQIEITITDPSDTITGLVENYSLKFAQY